MDTVEEKKTAAAAPALCSVVGYQTLPLTVQHILSAFMWITCIKWVNGNAKLWTRFKNEYIYTFSLLTLHVVTYSLCTANLNYVSCCASI